jgi:hypothetical protein
MTTQEELMRGGVGAANVVSSGISVTGNASVNGQLTASSANLTGGLSVAGVATVSRLSANSSISTNGDVNAPSNSWGSQVKLGTTFAGDPCGQESGSECPPGQFVCGVYVTKPATKNSSGRRSPRVLFAVTPNTLIASSLTLRNTQCQSPR